MTRPALAPNKSLGQHFLHDQKVLRRIADLSLPAAGNSLVEIGPGTGNLTEHLIAVLQASGNDRQLCLIEVDRRTPAVLEQRFGRVFELVMGDAADLDWSARIASGQWGPSPVVVGNLPYYAAIPILFSLLEAQQRPARIVAMIQREVAERLVAKAGASERGQVSVKMQWLADVRMAFHVGRGAFQPPPKVESTVVVLEPLAAPRYPAGEWSATSRLITAGFAQRRKTLVNALVNASYPVERVRDALAAAGLDPRIRAEAVDLPAWSRLTLALQQSALLEKTQNDGELVGDRPDRPLVQ